MSLQASNSYPEKMALQAAKKALRCQMKNRLSALSQSAIEEQSSEATYRILESPLFARSQRVSIFLSMPTSELSTRSLVQSAFLAKKQVFVPHLSKSIESDRGNDGYLPKRVMDMIALHSWEDFERLKPDVWGIPTLPDEGLAEREKVLSGRGGLDLILLPGVAFQDRVLESDSGIRRLGHGGGFYDFFLRRLRAKVEEEGGKVPVLMGVALKEQILAREAEEIPKGEWDQVVGGVFVGDGSVVGKSDVAVGCTF